MNVSQIKLSCIELSKQLKKIENRRAKVLMSADRLYPIAFVALTPQPICRQRLYTYIFYYYFILYFVLPLLFYNLPFIEHNYSLAL